MKVEAFGIEYEVVRYEVRCLYLIDGRAKLVIEEHDEWPGEVGSAETVHIVYRCGKCGAEITDGYVDHAFFCSKRYAVIETAIKMVVDKGPISAVKRAVRAYEDK